MFNLDYALKNLLQLKTTSNTELRNIFKFNPLYALELRNEALSCCKY